MEEIAMSDHGGWLVPVHEDLTGARAIICCLDQEMWGWVPSYWALWCGDCQAVVSRRVVGSEGITDIDDLPQELLTALMAVEQDLAGVHTREMAQSSLRVVSPVPVLFG